LITTERIPRKFPILGGKPHENELDNIPFTNKTVNKANFIKLKKKRKKKMTSELAIAVARV